MKRIEALLLTMLLACCSRAEPAPVAEHSPAVTQDEIDIWGTVLRSPSARYCEATFGGEPTSHLLFDQTQAGSLSLEHDAPIPTARYDKDLAGFTPAAQQAYAQWIERNQDQIGLPVDAFEGAIFGCEHPWHLGPMAETVNLVQTVADALKSHGGPDGVPYDAASRQAFVQFERNTGAHTLTRVGFSDDGKLAIVEHANHQFSLGGGGNFYVLRRTAAGWEIIKTIVQWQS